MASKRNQRRRGCEGKVAHATREEAWREANRLRDVHRGGTWTSYRCPHCSAFHVGRPNRRQRQSMTARRLASQR